MSKRKQKKRGGAPAGTKTQRLDVLVQQIEPAAERLDADPDLGGIEEEDDTAGAAAPDADPDLGGPTAEEERDEGLPVVDYVKVGRVQTTNCPYCGCKFFQDRVTPSTKVTKTKPPVKDGGEYYQDRYMVCLRGDCEGPDGGGEPTFKARERLPKTLH